MQDFHVHSNYSDGSFLRGMVAAAEQAGLEGVGFADHCNVASREPAERMRNLYGFSLDQTYKRRRQALETLRETSSIEIYDAVEMDYDPRDEVAIGEFLETAAFDYTIGSVHAVDGKNVQVASNFADHSEGELEAVAETYVEHLLSLVESELFDVAAHVDLIERTDPLCGRLTDDHYRQIARAFADSRTIPEINAGRAMTDKQLVHPDPTLVSMLCEFDVPFTLGTDAHRPVEVEPRVQFLEQYLETNGIDPVGPALEN